MLLLPNIRKAHNHAEAFRLLRYMSHDSSIIEHVWNSRDGVMPFCIPAKDGKTLLNHAGLHTSVYAPQYQPQIGERILVSATPETAWLVAEKEVERRWENLRSHYKTQGPAISGIAKKIRIGFSPILMVVTDSGLELF